MKGKKFKRALKRIFCTKERKRVALERKVYNALVGHDVDAMIEMIENGLDINMEIRKSSVTDKISSTMIWRPMDVLINNPYGPMQELLAGLNAKTQAEIYEQEMLRKEEERSLIAKEKERQCKCEEENKLRRVREFLKKTKD